MSKRKTSGLKILKTLQAAGYEAFFVGGYVRDTLLNIKTSDIDITTNATVEDVSKVFEKVILTGEKYGTSTVIMDKIPFEVTTYRTEGPYSDYRRPDAVTFTKTLKEDLARRDFTINQLIMDQDEDVHDHFNGLSDLKNRLIRTINAPEARFKEDALRLLRAFRFAAKLGFDIEQHTLSATNTQGHLIQKVAIERIQNELMQLFNEPYKHHALNLMVKSGFHKHLFNLDKAIETLAKINAEYDALIAFTILTLKTENSFELFKLSKKMMQAIETLIHLHMQTKDALFTPRMLFDEGLEMNLKANHLNRLLGYPDQSELIKTLDNHLPIRSIHDLAYKGASIRKNHPIKNKKNISIILNHLVDDVITNQVENTEEALRKSVARTLQKLEKSETT